MNESTEPQAAASYRLILTEAFKAFAPLALTRLVARLDKKAERLRSKAAHAEVEAALLKAKLRDLSETKELATTMFKQLMGQYAWLSNMVPNISDLLANDGEGDDEMPDPSDPPLPAKGQEWVSITSEIVYVVDSVFHDDEGSAYIVLTHTDEDGSFQSVKETLWDLLGGYRYRKPTMN